ncbi:class I SAM-dependent methyltransferase [Bacillus cereus]|uniref:class I SAM-dependent methyltransferase n=2 Tax=Bacillus cereus TaxID=1396 RepID=UPI000BF8AB64|nr:class I SAM-dependent methyltransferase [Bacillus cereus]MDF9596652.1 class I SAM-dependent methyltransferase [Bacillus cereus]MDF9609765.1 class I SAM-dependent methyltransferase [Bacillus cereus]MDF9659980.1 class I SAM-dependent methyltransferase [Bacillus cereus]PFX72056.1 hypothetical protein COL39_20620 [Bacillus cereus]
MPINKNDLELFKDFLSDKSIDNQSEKWGIFADLTVANTIKSIANSKGISSFILSTTDIWNLKEQICIHEISTLFITSQWVQTANLLQWECPSFHTYVCIGLEEPYTIEETKTNQLMNASLWDIINRRAKNNISAGGWFSSYTGESFSQQEMDEYVLNTKHKVVPYLSPNFDVLEIGCASGLTMYSLAPYVKTYTGIDMSKQMISQNQLIIKKQGISNIKVMCLEADQIEQLSPQEFNVIVMNSVSQYFHGYNYLRKIIKKMISLLPKTGIIFIGDVMDIKHKENLINSLKEFKKNNPKMQHQVKTQFENELFIPKDFFYDLQIESYEIIEEVIISDKNGAISNELRDFRYDVILKVDKLNSKRNNNNNFKQKKQYGYIFKSF